MSGRPCARGSYERTKAARPGSSSSSMRSCLHGGPPPPRTGPDRTGPDRHLPAYTVHIRLPGACGLPAHARTLVPHLPPAAAPSGAHTRGRARRYIGIAASGPGACPARLPDHEGAWAAWAAWAASPSPGYRRLALPPYAGIQ